MHVEVIRDNRVIVRVCGEVDLSNADTLRNCLDEATAASPNGFIVDMSDVQYIDSVGIAALMAAYQCLQTSGGKIALVVMDVNVRNSLALVHSEMLPGFLMCDDLQSAEHVM